MERAQLIAGILINSGISCDLLGPQEIRHVNSAGSDYIFSRLITNQRGEIF